jgi:1-acyl-sn-glycerol-3-phosphate acyltransferase
MREQVFQEPLYWLARGFVCLILRIRYRLHIHGRDLIPRQGGAVLVANHCSYLDPPVMAACSPKRIVHFMARDTLFSSRLAKWFFLKTCVIPLDRTKGDLGALRQAIATLKEGKVIGLFPEGTRSPDGQMREAKGGIGFLIAKGQVPVVPIYIEGTHQAFPKGADKLRPARISARVGNPISPEEIKAAMPKKGDYAAVGALVMQRIKELADEAQS